MTSMGVIVHSNANELAAAAADRLITAIAEAQAARGEASIVLTGGGTGIAVLAHLRNAPAQDTIDWSQVNFYWGDERFLPAGDTERNETQARAALLNHIPVDPARIHVMEPSDGRFDDNPEAAAEAYTQLLAKTARENGLVPKFDVCMLGMGGEGHVASVFPDSLAVHETKSGVVAVRNCPKPPPTRISLTLPAIRQSKQVWIMTTGEAKASAVASALGGANEVDIPAAGARGTQQTLWLIDSAAASAIPTELKLVDAKSTN